MRRQRKPPVRSGISLVTKVIRLVVTMHVRFPLSRRNNPRAAMVLGGLMGTVNGVSGGLAATDRRLVPYGALTATFHTGLGCLVAPSLLFLAVHTIVGH